MIKIYSDGEVIYKRQETVTKIKRALSGKPQYIPGTKDNGRITSLWDGYNVTRLCTTIVKTVLSWDQPYFVEATRSSIKKYNITPTYIAALNEEYQKILTLVSEETPDSLWELGGTDSHWKIVRLNRCSTCLVWTDRNEHGPEECHTTALKRNAILDQGMVEIYSDLTEIIKSGVMFNMVPDRVSMYAPRWVKEAVEMYQKQGDWAGLTLSEVLARMNKETNNV